MSTEEGISELEDRTVEVIEAEEQTETRFKKSEQSLRDPWDTIKRTNRCIVGVPGEAREHFKN